MSQSSHPSRLDPESAGELAIDVEKGLEEPKRYRVLLHNDHYTTMEFVVEILRTVFHRTESDSVRIMYHVHKNGMGVAGIYTHEIAETKVYKVHELGKQRGFPLRCTVEPES